MTRRAEQEHLLCRSHQVGSYSLADLIIEAEPNNSSIRAAASRKSGVSNPSVNHPYISSTSCRALLTSPVLCQTRARLMAALSSADFEPRLRAESSACNRA